VNAAVLGKTEALLTYCLKAYPGSADTYRRQVTRITQGASEQALISVRNSMEYRRAHADVEDFVGKVDARNVKRMCSESVPAAR